MVPWLRLAIAGLASGAGLLWAARGREARAASEALAGLERRARMPQRQPPGAWDLAGLPAPVRRYLNRVLPSAALSWAPIDDRRALATLSNGRSTVSLEFRFNADDEVIGIYTPGRWRSLGGRYELAAWEGKFRSYRRHQGVLVPTEGEVGWYSRDEWRPVWRGTVVAASLRFRRAARNPHESSEAIRT